MEALKTNLVRFENGLIALCFIVMTLCAFAQVVNRNFIGAGISWFDELARYCMVYLTILATEAGLRDGSQISITAFTDKMPPVLKRVVQIIVKLIVIAFSVGIAMSTMDLVSMQIRSGQSSAAMGLPMYVPYLSLPIGFTCIAAVQTISLIVLAFSPIVSKTNSKQVVEQGDK